MVTASENVPDEYVLPDNRTIALRMPNSPLVCQIAQQLGCPLATTSANTHGAPSAVDGCGLEAGLIEQADLTLDGGPAPLAIASTIVDCGVMNRAFYAKAPSQPRIFSPLRDFQNR